MELYKNVEQINKNNMYLLYFGKKNIIIILLMNFTW